MAAVLQEIPCRDTDPLPGEDDEQDSNRDSPVAFTINFGLGEDSELAKEKAKKLERFALRSSLRKPKSPRNAAEKSAEPISSVSKPSAIEIVRKSSAGQLLSKQQPRQLQREGSFVREKSNLSYRSVEKSSSRTSRTTVTKSSVISSHPSSSVLPARKNSAPAATASAAVIAAAVSSSSSQQQQMSAAGKSTGSGFNRRLTTTLSPEESKMISHFEKEMEAHHHHHHNHNNHHSLEIVENTYDEDTFEDDQEDEDEDEESAPSETGTYTVGKEDGKTTKHSEEKAREELESLVGSLEEARTNYVEDWANRHAARNIQGGERMASAPAIRPSLIPSPRGPGSPRDNMNVSPLLGGTKTSLSKSRRRLPATPGGVAGPVSPDNLTFSPESDSPSPQQESDEGESSYVKHTQHLVNVMEARINQKSNGVQNRTLVSKTTSSLKKTVSSPPSNTECGVQDAKEAWQRRKNYDPLAASGRKKEGSRAEMTRKGSSSSLTMGKSSRVNSASSSASSNRLDERGSAKSASSDSSGYFSRGESGRYSIRTGGPASLGKGGGSNKVPPVKPQSKLLNYESKQNSSRSSSSLTSKEAEFQAWKRRKNYDPLKSAASSSSTRKSSSPKSAYSPSPTSQLASAQPPPPTLPTHKRVQDMTQSLVHPDSSDEGAPMQRSASFHYENARLRALTSEDDSTEDYGSGCESSHAENGPRHYYLDEDELILPIYPSSSQRSVYAPKSLSPKVSPSRSRSRLEALDNLVISTIYSVSSKLCASTSNIIRKAGQSFPPIDEDQATTLETVLYLLEDVDLPSSPAKKTSRELSGTLRNMKKVEQAIEMLGKLMDNDGSEASQ